MDYKLLVLYLAILVIGSCLMFMALCVGGLVKWLSKKNPDLSYEFFKNLVYAIFTGIALEVVMNLRNADLAQLPFWAIQIPSTFFLLVIFSILGLVYLNLVDWIFKKGQYIKKIE